MNYTFLDQVLFRVSWCVNRIVAFLGARMDIPSETSFSHYTKIGLFKEFDSVYDWHGMLDYVPGFVEWVEYNCRFNFVKYFFSATLASGFFPSYITSIGVFYDKNFLLGYPDQMAVYPWSDYLRSAVVFNSWWQGFVSFIQFDVLAFVVEMSKRAASVESIQLGWLASFYGNHPYVVMFVGFWLALISGSFIVGTGIGLYQEAMRHGVSFDPQALKNFILKMIDNCVQSPNPFVLPDDFSEKVQEAGVWLFKLSVRLFELGCDSALVQVFIKQFFGSVCFTSGVLVAQFCGTWLIEYADVILGFVPSEMRFRFGLVGNQPPLIEVVDVILNDKQVEPVKCLMNELDKQLFRFRAGDIFS